MIRVHFPINPADPPLADFWKDFPEADTWETRADSGFPREQVRYVEKVER